MTLNKITSAAVKNAQSIHVKNKKPSLFEKRMGPMLKTPEVKTMLIKLLDTAFRSQSNGRVSQFTRQFFKKNNMGAAFSSIEKILVAVYMKGGYLLSGISIPLMRKQIRKITSPVVFIKDSKKFNKHLLNRKNNGTQVNVNLIGEALIGEQEAAERIKAYQKLLHNPQINYISIKISTIYSQIKSIAFDETVKTLVDKLSHIYDTVLAVENLSGEQKFVNLDMEEFRDLSLTIAAFKKTLAQKKYIHLRAGIVLQAYLPDAYHSLLDLQKWSEQRVNNGGAPIKIRLVKGANLEMELTEASMENWPLATYNSKALSDANFKRMLLKMIKAENLKHTHVGVASHNIFDLSFALELCKQENAIDKVDFEMLEGMANETVFALQKQGAKIILYTPIVAEEQYNSAIAYLVRRLDEGTQEGNFLKEGYQLNQKSKAWQFLENQFITAIKQIEKLDQKTHRIQNRSDHSSIKEQDKFANVPNTDWTIENNRIWINEIKDQWTNNPCVKIKNIPVIPSFSSDEKKYVTIENWSGPLPWQYEQAFEEDYNQFIDLDYSWTIPVEEKITILKKAAVLMEKNRGHLIAVATTELGKTVFEADVEVSEAIDFANYYAEQMRTVDPKMLSPKKQGIHLVLSPWNFPIAIPIGGVLASIAAGKRVILKPSSNAAATAYLTAKTLWDAGVPENVFAFYPTAENNLTTLLEKEDIFDAVILTGGTDTAKHLLCRNPRLKLYAETGGKNATVITALSDREQAIKNVVKSAFGNTGQKCSATSILFLEREVFEDKHFKTLLKDATESICVGNPWSWDTEIGPLALPVSEKIKRTIKNTKEEQWLVKPKLVGNYMLSPGIIWDVNKKDSLLEEELFGPILAVVCVENLKEACELIDNNPYGLTSGLESLDPKEINYWSKKIRAGNLYVNRSTTGAIVQRQPFGGMKASCFGFGMKAGGPNYVNQFVSKEGLEGAPSIDDLKASYKNIFSKKVDYSNIRGQHNWNTYIKPKCIYTLIDDSVKEEEINTVKNMAKIMNVKLILVSLRKSNLKSDLVLDYFNELWDQFQKDSVIRALNYKNLSNTFLIETHKRAIHVYGNPMVKIAELEWLNYLTEQNQSINYHRYGNLMGVSYKA